MMRPAEAHSFTAADPDERHLRTCWQPRDQAHDPRGRKQSSFLIEIPNQNQ